MSSKFFFLSGCYQNKLKLYVFEMNFMTNQLKLTVPKKCGFRSWKGSHIHTLFYWKSTPFKTLPEWNNLCRLCNKWSSCPPVRLNKNKGLSLLTVGQYAQDRVAERRQFCPLLLQWQGHFILKINKKVLNDREKVVNIVPDKLQSTLGLKLPPIFTLLPCVASRPGLLPWGLGGHHALKGHHRPKYQLLHMEQLGGAPLEFVESSDWPRIMRLYWQ